MAGECCSREVGFADASKGMSVDLWLIIAIGGTIGSLFLSEDSSSELSFHGTRLLHLLIQQCFFVVFRC